ncbi:2,4'-dihydroxyacetophenone dioxygenase family protein [Gordonia sp. PKS22-38]|uniref:2,4'-dihydroxyacetophenone dioxygenase family protein n=1 Tax=Gordonia prachuapensis TaxID=3115651 RepID=A0ABU7MT82_9ACTN|nr:2,4'-dihydroxyacetophenone dioxygenase family protein [Gordonia sp. PKS22-38]
MSSPTLPVPVTTTSGSLLPVVALPQGELLTVNANDNPLIRDALGPGVHFKPLRLDLEKGEWVVLATFAPGATVPLHYHTGTVDAYTLSGSWHYLEYPEQPQTAGSYLYEPGASAHTFICPEDNTEDTVVLFSVVGANVNFNEDGSFHSILDTALIRHLTGALAEAQGSGPVRFISGGFAGFDVEEA